VTRPALVPELYVSDLAASLAFYVDLLGFEIDYERPEERFAALRLGAAHLMLEQAPSLGPATREELAAGRLLTAQLERPFGRGVNFEIRVADAHAAGARIEARGHPLLLPVHERTYRVDQDPITVEQLLVADPDGYLIRLSCPRRAGGTGPSPP